MANIFVSYSRANEVLVRSLSEDINALGHSAWFDQELSGGQAWWDLILRAIRECEVFVFVLSPDSLNSTACKREFRYANELGKSILPVLVSDGVATHLLPPALSHIQFVDYRKRDREAAFRFARALSTLPPPSPLPDPLPSPPEVPVSYLGSVNEQVDTGSVLTLQQQGMMLIDLKRGLRDPTTRDDARMLLENMRKRPDLLVSIAEEIDDVLESLRPASPPAPAAGVSTFAGPGATATDAPGEASRPADAAEREAGGKKAKKTGRLKGALRGLAVGAVVQLLFLVIWEMPNTYTNPTDWYAALMITGSTCAVAGAISLMDRKIVRVAGLAFVVGVVVFLMNGDLAFAPVLGGPAAILGAILGRVLKRFGRLQ